MTDIDGAIALGDQPAVSHAAAFLLEHADEPGRRRVIVVCWHIMKRTTIKLSDDLDARLRHEADRRGTTISAITREAIQVQLGTGSRRQLGAAKAGNSGGSDISERIEEILRGEVGR